MGKSEGSRLVHPAHGIPRLLNPLQAKEHHKPGPLHPFEPGPPGKGGGAGGPGSRRGADPWLSQTVGGLGVGIPRAGTRTLSLS